MWQLDNRTPFAAERTWVRDRDGAEIWLVAVKATFDVLPDASLLVADEQVPVTLAPIHLGEPGRSSLRYETDLPRTKLTTDIVVHADAHALDGHPVECLDVGIAVGTTVKVLKVFGDRCWRGGRISKPTPFVSMPIVYERAFGGADPKADTPSWDLRNPIGQGYAVSASHMDGMALPNIEDPNCLIRSRDDRPSPSGLGPLSCHWQTRQRWAGTYDDRWQRDRFPLLPTDFDDRYYQCAPEDQQTPQFLRGGEPVVLRNLTPGGGDLRYHLPRVYLGFETFFFTGPSVRHDPPKLHTVLIEPSSSRVSLVWHSALPCHPRVLKLKHTKISLKQDLRDGVLSAGPVSAEA